MNREEYLKQLKFTLEGLPQDEIKDILYDYKEHFDIGLSKGKSEEEISMELGDPGEVSNNYKGTSNYNYSNNNYDSNNNNYNDDMSFSKDIKRNFLTRKTIGILLGITLVVLGSSLLYLNANKGYRDRSLISINNGNELVKMNGKGIEVKDGNSYVSIGWNGIKVTDGNENVSIGWNGIRINGEDVSNFTSDNNAIFNSSSKDLISKTIDEEKLETLDGISSLSAVASFVDIKIIPQERNDVRIHYHGSIVSNVVPVLNVNKKSSNLEIKLETPKNTSTTIRESDLVLEIFVPATFSGNYNVVTASGDISFKLSDKLNYTVNGTTSSGTFKSNMPMNMVENQKRKFKGVIGSGDKEIKVTTSSGDVRFDQK